MGGVSFLHDRTEESLLVGQILTGYGELEFQLKDCVSEAIDDDDSAIKALFRMRGEAQRIEIADALVRQKYIELGLETEFCMALGAMRYCKNIRNAFAHCVWHMRNQNLFYVNLEELAKSNEKIDIDSMINFYPVTLDLLKAQLAYLEYADECLRYARYRARALLGRPKKYDVKKPKQLEQPPLYSK